MLLLSRLYDVVLASEANWSTEVLTGVANVTRNPVKIRIKSVAQCIPLCWLVF